jgi:hypothetical protein
MGSCYLRWARGVVNCETLEYGDMSQVWVAHASRVLVSAARRNDLFWSRDQTVCVWTKKFAIARRARQHASRVRYPDNRRHTPKIDKHA